MCFETERGPQDTNSDVSARGVSRFYVGQLSLLLKHQAQAHSYVRATGLQRQKTRTLQDNSQNAVSVSLLRQTPSSFKIYNDICNYLVNPVVLTASAVTFHTWTSNFVHAGSGDGIDRRWGGANSTQLIESQTGGAEGSLCGKGVGPFGRDV